jgi:hypothetical protein
MLPPMHECTEKSSNINLFVHIGHTLNCESPICVDLFESERAHCSFFETCRIVNLHKDFIANFLVSVSLA